MFIFQKPIIQTLRDVALGDGDSCSVRRVRRISETLPDVISLDNWATEDLNPSGTTPLPRGPRYRAVNISTETPDPDETRGETQK